MAKDKYGRTSADRHAEYERAKAKNPNFAVEKNRKERENWRKKHPLKPENMVLAVFYKGSLISRKEAIRVGERKYFTGKACKFGHVDQWNVSGGCLQCQRVRLSKKENGKSLEWLDLESVRPKPSVCDICGRKSKRIILDHCHGSGNFRGWLCDKCNFSLGLANDDPIILKKMAKYLECANGKVKRKTEEGTSIGFFRWSRPQLSDS